MKSAAAYHNGAKWIPLVVPTLDNVGLVLALREHMFPLAAPEF